MNLQKSLVIMTDSLHTTVLLQEAIEALAIQPSDVVVDATIGGAGHFSVLLSVLSHEGTLIGIDADSDAIARAQSAYEAAEESPQMYAVQSNFRELDSILEARGIEQINKSLFDLGWSGYQLSAGKGFSFQVDEPLLMTYGESEDVKTAAEFLNTASEQSIADVLYELGEEQFSRQIAREVATFRKSQRILTTFDLVEIVKKGTPGWYQRRRLHPATKTFQALRIYINDELGALREGLTAALLRTAPGGRVAVISFHSIEDRIVKLLFKEEVVKGNGGLVTKKPIIPSAEELSRNPRSRSAKLRVFEVCSKKHRANTTFNSVPSHNQTMYA
jgi:16S rRNA (cytosine1402-N4)-methyltransferase